MSYLPSQVTKAKKLREHFRKAKRKQFATIAAVVVVVLFVCVCVVMLGVFVKSLFNQDTSISSETFALQQPGIHLISPTWNTLLQPAPWFVGMAKSSLVLAGDTTGSETGFPSIPVNFLAGYSAETEGPTWRRDFKGPLTSLTIAGDRIIAFRQVLSEPPGIELSGYNLEDGIPVWNVAIELAEQGRIEIAENVVCLTYQMPDGPRIAGYNCETGVKAWGIKLPLDETNPGAALTTQVYLEAVSRGEYLAYYVDRFFGLVDTSTGKLIRRYTGQGPVVDAAISGNESQVFLVERGLNENQYRLITFPYRDGNPLVIHEYTSSGGNVLLCNGLYAIIIFSGLSEQDVASQTAFVAGFTTAPSGPQFVHKLPPGYVDDATAIPGSLGEFLLASNSGRTKTGIPSGHGSLLRVSFKNQGLEEMTRFNNPVSWLVPFKSQCVVLLHGGRVVSYLNELGVSVSIENLRFPNLDPVLNRTRDSLAVLSYPNSYADGNNECMMAVTVFE